MKKYFSLVLSLALAMITSGALAQWYNDTVITNVGSLATDLNGQGYNVAGAVYSTAGSSGAPSSFGVFNHWGQSGSGANAAFINDGSYDASINGRDYFSGPGNTVGQQEIAGTIMPVFGELFLQNGASSAFNITNSNGIRVATSISFENGITTTVRSNTNTGAIQLDDGATYSNSALGDAQHVNGYVSKIGNDAFIFPVGSGSDLRTLAISAPATATDEYSVAWLAGSPSITGDPSDAGALHPVNSFTAPIVSVSAIGQWDWIAVNGTGNGITITVSMPDLSGSGIASSDLRLVGWNGSSWIDLSGGSTATGNTEGDELSGTMQTGITAIGIGSVNNIILPVDFLYFKASPKGCSVSLTWGTAREINSSFFDIERSTDGTKWETIGNLKTAGNYGPHRYSFTDETVQGNTVFYRLRETDIDGSAHFSSIAVAHVNCGAPIVIYPNPAREYFTVSGVPANSVIQLINSSGNVVREQKTSATGIKFIIRGLVQGIYTVRVVKNAILVGQTRLVCIPD